MKRKFFYEHTYRCKRGGEVGLILVYPCIEYKECSNNLREKNVPNIKLFYSYFPQHSPPIVQSLFQYSFFKYIFFFPRSRFWKPRFSASEFLSARLYSLQCPRLHFNGLPFKCQQREQVINDPSDVPNLVQCICTFYWKTVALGQSWEQLLHIS